MKNGDLGIRINIVNTDVSADETKLISRQTAGTGPCLQKSACLQRASHNVKCWGRVQTTAYAGRDTTRAMNFNLQVFTKHDKFNTLHLMFESSRYPSFYPTTSHVKKETITRVPTLASSPNPPLT